MIQVRKVQPKDLEYILQQAERLSFQSSIMISKLENMMIVIDNNKICGFGFYINFDSMCLVNWVSIDAMHRRGRLATMLVKTMLNLAEQQGAVRAYFSCDCPEFAEFLGFEKISEQEQVEAVNRVYEDLYQVKALNDLFKVSLLDFFKPCCHTK